MLTPVPLTHSLLIGSPTPIFFLEITDLLLGFTVFLKSALRHLHIKQNNWKIKESTLQRHLDFL